MRGVGVDVVRAGMVEIRIAGRGNGIIAGRSFQPAFHRWIPIAGRSRRIGPIAAGRVRIQVHADKAELMTRRSSSGKTILGETPGN